MGHLAGLVKEIAGGPRRRVAGAERGGRVFSVRRAQPTEPGSTGIPGPMVVLTVTDCM